MADVTIKHYSGDVSDLETEMIGMDDTTDSITGNKNLFYKDQDGGEHKVANLDEPVRFTDLTATGDVSLPAGSIDAEDISDLDTEISNNIDVAANTAARHDAVTVADTSEIDLTLSGQEISADIVAGSIDETKLDTSVNASLDLADSAVQPTDSSYTSLISSEHTHTNKTILDNTTASFTSADETKLDGIEAEAEVNNISDTNAGLLTGGVSTSVPHLHRGTLRNIPSASSGTVVTTDEQNGIKFPDTCSAGTNDLYIPDAIVNTDGFCFDVVVPPDYISGINVHYSPSRSAYWTLSCDESGLQNKTYIIKCYAGEFSVIGSGAYIS